MKKLASDTYQISYKSGQVEILKNHSNTYKRSVLHEVYASTGRSLVLEWDRSGDHRVSQKSSKALKCFWRLTTNLLAPPTITRAPNTPEASTFTIVLKNNRLEELRLPLEDTTPWKILYNSFGHIRHVTSPSGLVEEIQYKEDGHHLPTGAPYQTIPYVISHTERPGNGQDAMVTNYTYSSRNFLGYNGSHDWNDGEDNLFRSPYNYTYDSTVTVQGGAQTKNTYNKFHLLFISERQKNTKKVTQTITYHANVSAAFDAQPAQYQLPKRVDTKYEDTSSKASRTETSHHQFDEWGNPTEETESNGIITIRQYYPPSGEKGPDNVVKCPADPYGFKRYIKTETIRPGPSDHVAPPRVESYTYSQVPAATGGKAAYFVVVKQRQDLGTGAVLSTVLTTTDYDYVNQPTTRDHGRLRQQVAWVTQELPIAQDWIYSYPNNNQLSQTMTTRTFDGSTVAEQTVYSLWSGLTVSYKNEADITEHFYYDKIGRQIKAVTAQGTPYESAQETTYAVLGIPNGTQRTITEATGVKTRYTSDGLERLYTIHKQDDMTQTMRLVQQNKYNAQGQETEVIEMDWLRTGNKDKPTEQRSTKSIEYDDWGNVSKVTESNGLVTLTAQDPISLTTTEGIRGEGTTKTEINLFGTPKAISLLKSDSASTLYSKISYAYDGFGRCVSKTDHLGRKTAYDYDHFDRIKKTTWPSGRVVDTQYADHTTAILPKLMQVNGKNVGQQSFDGLDRITSKVVGARLTRQTYERVTPEPVHITSSKGDQIDLTYESALDHAPTSVRSADTADSFQYDHRLGALSGFSGSYSTHNLEHFPSGLLSKEVIKIKGTNQLSASYTYSMAGKLQSYTDVHGTTSVVDYDGHGRPARLTQGKVAVSLTYNSSNRVSESRVEDEATKMAITTKLTYDDFGRETKRSVYRAGTTLLFHLSQSYNEIGLLSSRKKENDQGILREESFQYDIHNHLVRYDCSGSQPPTDHQGRRLRSQQFTFDSYDNITQCSTVFQDGSNNTAVYSFSEQDPTQLVNIVNSSASDPAKVDLEYDANGCLTRDEQGRILQYNSMSRLTAVLDANRQPLCQYEYDASGKLACQVVPNQPDTHFFYRGDSLIAVKGGDRHVSYVSSGSQYWAETATQGASSKTSLWAVDSQQSVLTAMDSENADVGHQDYTPYCFSSPDGSSPSIGFNGQWRDPVTGWYHLGNGYRVYNPVLMRFHTPDPWSPFTSGEVNPYAYCLGDPINRVDPSGHFSLFGLKLGWKDLIMAVVGIAVSIGVGILTGGASFAIQVGVGLAAGVLSDVVSGVVGDLADGNKPTWKSVGLDALGGLLGGIGGAVGDTVLKQGFKQGMRAVKAGSMAVKTALGRAGSYSVTKPVVSAAAGSAVKKSISATVKSTVRGIARGFIPAQAAARGGVHLTGLASEDPERPAEQQRPAGESPVGVGSRGSTGRNGPAQVGSQSYYLSRGSSVARDIIRPAMKNGGGPAVTSVLRPPQVSTWFLSGYGADPGAGQASVANLLNRDVRFAYELSGGVVSEQDDESEL